MTTGLDIILGVARAADTAKQRDAAARLEGLSRKVSTEVAAASSSTEPALDWSTELRRASEGAAPATDPVSAPVTTNVAASAIRAESTDKKSDVYVQFEAVLLQNMVEAMMPEDSQAMFGSGTAGSMWKSMLAEKVAAEIARSGAVGIAKQVAGGEAARLAVAPTTNVKVDDV